MRLGTTLGPRSVLLTVALLVCVLASGAFVPAASAQTYVPYVVQPGDTLGKIAARYCTTWEEIYYLNAGVIGPDPNLLRPGTLLYVPNRCTTSSGGSGVYDHGPTMYANGTVTCNVYTVDAGDTWYSIGVRFGLPWETISAANGGGGLYPGRQIYIPGLPCTTSPTPPPQKTYVTITNPQPGASLPNTFTVSGNGAGLPEGNVVVTAKDSSGRILAQKATTLQGSNVGTGGEGAYSVSLTVNVGDITPGYIESTSPGVQAIAGVSITYSGAGSGSAPPSGSTGVVYAPGECTITSLPGAYYYQYPGGPVAGQFVSATKYQAKQRTVYNNTDWYMFETEPGTGNPPVWVSINGLSSIGSGCR